MSDDALRRLDALLTVALRLARTAPSGRVALAQLAEAIELRWVPLPWGEPIVVELEAALRDSLEPLPLELVEKILRDAWGVHPGEEIEDLEPEPVRIQPTAQIHRARLEGRPVAVKVLRPGLGKMIRQDLTLLEALAGPLRSAFPALDAPAILAEVKERVLEELDLESEAHVQRRFHRALREHPRFLVPAPVTRLSHESVLVRDWVDGVPLTEAPDRDAACALLVQFALGAARWGTAHAALDPRDVLVLDDGRVAIVEINSSRAVEPARLDLAAQGVEAFVERDQEALGAALAQLGWLPPELAATADGLLRQTLGSFGEAEPVRLDSDAVVELRDRLLKQPEQLSALVGAGSLHPQDLWPARGLAQLFSTIARTGATAPWRELLREGLRAGWEADVLA